MAQLTTTEAAKLMGVSGYEVGRLIEQGKLTATKVGYRRMIEADDLETYLRDRSGVREAASTVQKIEALEAEVEQLRTVLGSPSDPASRERIRAIRAEWELEHGQRKRNTLSRRLRWLIFERDGHRCVYCGAEPADGIKLTIDHRLAVIDGGTDDPENLATALPRMQRGQAGQAAHRMTGDAPTPAELRALRAYVQHGSAKAAGESLGLAESTVKGELASIRSKLGVHRTVQAALILHAELAA